VFPEFFAAAKPVSGPFLLVHFRENARTMTSPDQKSAQVEDESSLWLLPGDALARVREVISEHITAIDTIVDRLKVGLVKATYETLAWENTSRRHTIQQKFIPQDYWKHYTRSAASSRIWDTSDLRLFLGAVDGSLTENNSYLTFFQVRLGSDGIDKIIANTPRAKPATMPAIAVTAHPSVTVSAPSIDPSAKASAATNRGGRPRKEWWDDFWIEICRKIYDNEIKELNTQADLERVMLEWVENHRNGEVGETTIKAAAKKLFKAWSLGSKT
jgi:hypothetical protein